MRREPVNDLHLWQFDIFSRYPAINHFVTDRNTGGNEFTLSLSSTPDKEKVRENRRSLAIAMGVDPDRLFFPSQVHGTEIVNVTPHTSKESLMGIDALITQHREVCLAVMSADCVPILLYDTKRNVVAAVHSGWRGTVARILQKTLLRMKDEFGCEGRNIIAGIGPSVSQESYEVGEEVINEVHKAFGVESDLLLAQPLNKARLDLWKANQLQLVEFGVPSDSIEVSDLCTVKNNAHFFSARKGDSGRFAAGIMMR
jgi:polyphenol oxidase